MKTSKVPDRISSPIRRLCNRLSLQSKPLFIPVQPDPGAIVNDCFATVAAKVLRDGGEIQYGWRFWHLPGILMEAEFHASWQSLKGDLIDVSPNFCSAIQILFIPDPTRRYDGRQIDNVRIPLSKDPRVREYIALAEKKFAVMNEGPLSKKTGLISLPKDKILPIFVRMGQLQQELGIGKSTTKDSNEP